MKIALIIVLIAYVTFAIIGWVRGKERNWLSIASDVSLIIFGIIILTMFFESLDALIPDAVEITLIAVAFVIMTISTVVDMVKESRESKRDAS